MNLIPTISAYRIAMLLKETEGSPYRTHIRQGQGKNGIALSTIVSALKPFVVSKGALEQNGLVTPELQFKAILNFFCALKFKYGPLWDSNNNVFLRGVGFAGALNFYINKILPHASYDFTTDSIAATLHFDQLGPIEPPKNRGYKASRFISDQLAKRFIPTHSPTPLKI
jgi:hypothetical protein